MYSINDLKPGLIIKLNQKPYLILKTAHLKLGRGGAILQTKLKCLSDGTIINKNFKGAEKIPEADVTSRKLQFLYREKNNFIFMDQENFEQISLKELSIKEAQDFLKEGETYTVLFYDNTPIKIELPIKMDFKVVKAEPGTRGDTISKATKKATIETGLTLAVPLFIKEGDIIRIDTRTGEYLERVR